MSRKRRLRAKRWREKKEWLSREPDMMRRAAGLPTDHELLKGSHFAGSEVGLLSTALRMIDEKWRV